MVVGAPDRPIFGVLFFYRVGGCNKSGTSIFNLPQKKPITPSDKEIGENPPSRSAKFRFVIKKTDFYNFDTDIKEQFRNLIEIENYGDKL